MDTYIYCDSRREALLQHVKEAEELKLWNHLWNLCHAKSTKSISDLFLQKYIWMNVAKFNLKLKSYWLIAEKVLIQSFGIYNVFSI